MEAGGVVNDTNQPKDGRPPMPSRKEMEALLRAEGWRFHAPGKLGIRAYWASPQGNRYESDAEYAYQLATRRKAARETRRLKAAGWIVARYATDWGPYMWKHPGITRWVSKAEAIQALAEGPKPKAQGSKSKSPSQKGRQ